jgi:hypothetical protein
LETFLETFWGETKKNDRNPSSMSTPSLLDLVSANPEILGSATRPASAMGQIDPAPPAELVDAVSASPLEPFANPGAARQEPGEEPTMTQNVERPTMAADGFRLSATRR